MIKLSNAALSALPPGVTWAGYDRSRLTAGILHFSVGNFHRAHQAVYLDQLIAGGGHDDWAICGVGLMDDPRERAKAASFPRQDCLYTLLERSDDAETVSVVGALCGVIYAGDGSAALLCIKSWVYRAIWARWKPPRPRCTIPAVRPPRS